jgi:H+-transporting ATPase
VKVDVNFGGNIRTMLIDDQEKTKVMNDTNELFTGLSQSQANRLLKEYGPNAIPETKTHPWLIFLSKMWAPVPWMLEVSILLEILLGRYLEAGVIGALVLFNAWVSTVQENRAQDALKLLKKRLVVSVRVSRNGNWRMIPGSELVPGDIVHIRMGDLVPADLNLISGEVSLDQSTLTGESLPVEAEKGAFAYAGTVVQRGEATGRVTGTGIHTKYGKTAELVRLARSTGKLEKLVFAITKSLIVLDAFLVVIVLIYALLTGLSLQNLVSYSLILLVASVPVALPATFTVATALGALELVHKGVLVTRLSAIEEAASMQVLCTDKTGTLTENRLKVAEIKAFPPYTNSDVIRLAVMASDAATQDPLDKAILEKARLEHVDINFNGDRQKFIPFEPSTRRSEGFFKEDGQILHVMKGAPQVISTFDPQLKGDYAIDVEAEASRGLRVLAIASGTDHQMHIAGLVALQDPPRSDSFQLISRLKEMGIRVVMITGDSLQTAKAIAARIGIGNHACSEATLEDNHWSGDEGCEVYAEVLPEKKFQLVRKYQQAGLTVGMTGDGVNDAPALKEAEVGIAVSNATDVAKAAASLVLTSPGLENLVSAIETSRQIYQRMLTYTLNKIIKTIVIAFFLSFGLIFAHTFVTTPLLIVLLLFANDFVTMSIATDHVRPSSQPNRWNIRSIVLGAVSLALPILALSFAIFLYAQNALKLPLEQLQTLLFVMLVFAGQGTIYLVRERDHFWHSLPSRWMLIGSLADIIVVTFMATTGLLMAPISLNLVIDLLVIICIYLAFLDIIKVPLFRLFRLR